VADLTTIKKLKEIDLVSFCTNKLGLKVIHDTGGRVYFYSPFRAETTPSFSISRKTNTYRDWGKDTTDSSSKGDIIDLVVGLEGNGFSKAVESIANDYAIEMPVKFAAIEESNDLPGILVESVSEISDKLLTEYIRNRKIDVDLCRMYCKQLSIRFPYSKTHPDKLYTCIGFPNDSGGYEVRNSFLKKSTRPKIVTTIRGTKDDEWQIIEGFFDFLSALMYFGVERFDRTTIVLNTTAFLGSIRPMMAEKKMNWVFLDTDGTGRSELGKMEVYGIPHTDCSWIYEGYKDFNDFWKNK